MRLAAPLTGLAFCLGIVLTVLGDNPNVPWDRLAIGCLISGTGLGLASLARRRSPLPWMVIAALGIGLARGVGATQSIAEPWLDLPITPVQLVAVVDTPVESRGTNSTVTARIERVVQPDGLVAPSGRLRISTVALTAIQEGDRIDVTGRFAPVPSDSSFGARLLRQGVVATTSGPQLLTIGRADAARPVRWVRSLQDSLQSTIDRVLPEPNASLLAGLLIGANSDMPDGFRQALVSSGTTHIVVVSGYNIMLVAGALIGIFRWRRRVDWVVPLIGVWGFALLAGASSPSIRAALMATVGLIGYGTGRGRDALVALLVAGVAMLAVDPLLVADLSFQLSVLATMGLVALQPRVAALFRWLPPATGEPLSGTLAAQLTTLPVLAATFHLVSVASPLANVLVAPWIPIATILGAILTPLAMVVPALSVPVGLILWVPTQAIIGIVSATAALPHPTIPVGVAPPLLVGAYGIGLLIWAILPTPEGRDLVGWVRARRALHPALAGMAALITVWLLAVAFAPGHSDVLTASVLDVGEGDAILVRTPGGRTILVDGGPNPTALLEQLGRRMGLFERSLSVAVLTRADGERLPGLVAAVERYPSELAIHPPEGSTLALHERWTALGSTGTSLRTDLPRTIQLEPDLSVELIPTAAIAPMPGPNARTQRTLAMRLRYRDVALFLAPSLTTEGASVLHREGWSLNSDVLLVPRHGDLSGLDSRMLSAVSPQIAVLSVGARNRAGHPAAETLQLLQGTTVYRTDLQGSIDLQTDGQRLWVTSER